MPLIAHNSWRARTAIALSLSLLFSLVLSSLSFASGGLVQVSSDPYTNKSSQHQTQLEPDNYSSGSTIVNAFQSGRFFDGGSSNIGWATSTDKGSTWKHGFLPGTTVYATPKGKYARISDPAVAYDAAHKTWLVSTIAILINGGSPVGAAVLINSSTDGLTWNNPVAVADNGGNGFFDKEWVVCDDTSSSKYYGHCYVEYDDANNGDLVQMSTSSDGGKTWGASKPTRDNAHGLGGQPLVQPNGTVVVPFAGAGIESFTSTDGGNSWNKSVLISTANSAPEGGNLRSGPLPSAEIDGAGKVYVVWEDCRFEHNCANNDIVMSTSTNGTSWSKAQRIPIDRVHSGEDHFLPGIAVDKTTSGNSAHIGIAFYFYPVAKCNPSNCRLDVGFVSSTDGGSIWSKKVQLAGPMKVTWLANTNQGYMVGDYISTTINNGKAFPIFAVATAPKNGVFNEAMYTVAGGLTITGGSASSAGDQVYSVSTHTFVPFTAY